jgi:hypothetical protein
MRGRGNLWSATTQSRIGRPEATACGLLALEAWGRSAEAEAGVKAFERAFTRKRDPVLWSNVTPLALSIRMLARVAPTSPMLIDMAQALWDGARASESGDTINWSARVDVAKAADEASAVHTAHAITALVRGYHAAPGKFPVTPSSLKSATRWLLSAPYQETDVDRLTRPRGNAKHDILYWRHFTTAWVLMALVEGGADPTHPRLAEAAEAILSMRSAGPLWTFPGSAELPIWLTCDAIQALTTYALGSGDVA